MKRSFTRKGAVSFVASDPSTRVGPRGLTLVSTGVPDLDTLLGGGLPLGCILLVLDDGVSPHAATLLRCFVAQGVACGQRTHWALPKLPPGGVAGLLPALATSTSQKQPSRAAKKDEDDEVELRIAWQYKQYLKNPAGRPAGAGGMAAGGSGMGSPGPDGQWCHQFDLTKTMSPALVEQSRLEACAYSGPQALETLSTAARFFAAPIPVRPAEEPSGLSTCTLDSYAVPAQPGQNPSPPKQDPLPAGISFLRSDATGRGPDALTPPTPPLHTPGRAGSSPATPMPDQAPDANVTGPYPALPHGANVTAPSLAPDVGSLEAERAHTNPTNIALPPPHGAHVAAPCPAPDVGPHAETYGAEASPTKSATGSHANPAEAGQGKLAELSHAGTERGASPGSAGAESHVNPAETGQGADTAPAHADAGRGANPGHAPQEAEANPIGRLAVQALGGPAWKLSVDLEEASWRLLRAVFSIKGAVRDTRTAAIVSCPAGMYPGGLTQRLQHMCDAVIAVEGVRDDSPTIRLVPDPSSCVGTLRLLKLPALHSLGRSQPDVELHVIRSRRRRIAIEPFQVDPDAGVGDTERGPAGAKPAAAALCGGPPSAGNPLEF